MQTISFEITDEEAAAILANTRESAQAFLERNARVHVKDCCDRQRSLDDHALGLPATIGTIGLKDDEVAYLRRKRADEKAAAESEKAIEPK